MFKKKSNWLIKTNYDTIHRKRCLPLIWKILYLFMSSNQTNNINIYRDIPIQRVFSSVSMDKNTSLSKREYFNLFCQT